MIIIVYVDFRNKGECKDVFFYYYLISFESKIVVLDLQYVLCKKYCKYCVNGQYYGMVIFCDLYMLREILIFFVYVELVNIRNKFD